MMKKITAAILFSALMMNATAWADLNSGLMAHYTFDGNVNDVSGNNNHGTIHGGVTLTTDSNGKADSAYLFNGVNGYISVPDAPSLHPVDQLTISAWVRYDTIPSYWATIIEKGEAGKGADPSGCYAFEEYSLFINNTSLFDVESAGDSTCNVALKGKPVSLGKWHLITAVIDRKTKHLIQMYADGVLQTKQKDNYNTFNATLAELRIGFSFDLISPNSAHFKGAMDDIRLYNRALSAAEVSQLYRTSQQIGGSTGGYSTINVTCSNITTAQKITFTSTNTKTSSWNCEQKGLIVNFGDQVDVTLSGKAH